METIKNEDTVSSDTEDCFGKAPQPWQLRNNWLKPKRIRKSKELDLWQSED